VTLLTIFRKKDHVVQPVIQIPDRFQAAYRHDMAPKQRRPIEK